jgi:protein-tyrosine phosphatase
MTFFCSSMTPVLPRNLWLGSIADSRNKVDVRKNSITAMVNLTSEEPNHVPDNVKVVWVPLLDGFDNKPEQFADAVKALKTLVDAGHNVLVHCRMGMSRSPTVVAAYLAETTEELTFDAAVDLLKKMRPVVSPHHALRQMAKQYLREPWSIYTPDA